jgi:hypothetical protein
LIVEASCNKLNIFDHQILVSIAHSLELLRVSDNKRFWLDMYFLEAREYILLAVNSEFNCNVGLLVDVGNRQIVIKLRVGAGPAYPEI